MLFSDSHQECNICKKSCLEMASVGIETLLKAILERTDRLARNIGRRDHSKCTGDGCFESNLRWKTLLWKRGDNGLPDAVVHRGQVWRTVEANQARGKESSPSSSPSWPYCCGLVRCPLATQLALGSKSCGVAFPQRPAETMTPGVR